MILSEHNLTLTHRLRNTQNDYEEACGFYNRSNGNRIECELRGVGTCSVVKTVYKVRRSS